MRSPDDRIFTLISAIATSGRSPNDASMEELLAAMYLLLVDAAVHLHVQAVYAGVRTAPRLHVTLGMVLAVVESWALAVCEVCSISYESWARYARERWDTDVLNRRSRVYKVLHDDIDIWASRTVKS
jgi:hypothetical protein